MMGCHQPSERFKGTIIPFAWFAQGLRILDIADPLRAEARSRSTSRIRRRASTYPLRTMSRSTIAVYAI